MTSTVDAPATSRRVTPTGILVLPSTAPRDQWLTARQRGITATDITKIVGLSDYGDALTVAQDKNGPYIDDEISEKGQWGQELEPYVARRWAEQSGIKVRRIGLLANQDQPWMLASLDREEVGGCDLGRGGCEIKTTGQWVRQSWEDGVPPRVNVQVQWQLAVSGLDHMHVAALIGGQHLVEHVIYPDQARIADLTEAGALVWDAIRADTTPVLPPHLLTVNLLNAMYPDRSGQRVVDGDVARQLLTEYADAGAGAKAFEETKKRVLVELVAMLDDGDEAVDEHGRTLFTYRAQSRRSTDLKALEADWPDAFAACVTTSSSPTFRPAKQVTS